MLGGLTVKGFIQELASDSPAPGGGSVAALCGSLGAALSAMVAQLTVGREKYKDSQAIMEKTLNEANDLKTRFLDLMEKDTESFNLFMQARKLPKETDHEKAKRAAAIEEATKQATMIPLETVEACVALAHMALAATLHGNPNAKSDGGVAGLLAVAAAKGAAYNVRINLPGVKDQAFVEDCKKRIENACAEVVKIGKQIEENIDSSL